MKSKYAVVHYAEIGLKGRNRPFFERKLMDNIVARLKPVCSCYVERLSGRLLVHADVSLDETIWDVRLRTIFGIANFGPALVTPPEMDAIETAVLEHLPHEPVETFRITASRDDKSFHLISPQIERRLGATVQERTGWPVSLGNAALDIGVEILHDRAIVTFDRLAGPGGLPVGVSGHVSLLLSGGIDSPVAGYMALKRGCRVTPVHFHSRPFGNWMGAQARAREIVRALTVYGMEPVLAVVPIGRQQREITVQAPDPFRVILYRRLMVRIAEVLSRRNGRQALFTGEALGQVASQTVESLSVVEAAVELPILRPLIGMDKQEIVDMAHQIGTFELSQMEGDDCCQFLMPDRVVTRPTLGEVEEAEAALEVDRLVEEALENASWVEIDSERE
ncbi:MAG: tRNA uracil 4-sulfurtransferase ThiI [Anaerolineae bacterium]